MSARQFRRQCLTLPPSFASRAAGCHIGPWKEQPNFVTFRIATSQLTTAEILSVRDQIISGDPELYELLAAVVLPDHVHLLLRPNQGVSLSRAMKGIKGATARRLNQRRGSRGSVWQEESFDRIVRDEAGLKEKLNYMFKNPVKAGLSEDACNYPGWYLKGQTRVSAHQAGIVSNAKSVAHSFCSGLFFRKTSRLWCGGGGGVLVGLGGPSASLRARRRRRRRPAPA